MNRKPLVLVLLATYNGDRYLIEQLNSIKNQIDINLKVVVSDDLSTDNTLNVLKDYDTQQFQLNLLTLEKQGSAAKNFFRLLRDTDLTAADYVALSDQDDIWFPQKISEAVKSINLHHVDAYSSNVIATWSSKRKKIINKAQPQQRWDYIFESAGPGCTFVLSKKLALAIQEFLSTNEEKCNQVALHDWFIYSFARSRDYKWLIDKTPHMLYRQHSENAVGANVGINAKLVRWKKMRQGWLNQQALLIADILKINDVWPIQKLKRYHLLDRLALIANIHHLRRRLRDRVAFALFLLFP